MISTASCRGIYPRFRTYFDTAAMAMAVEDDRDDDNVDVVEEADRV